MRNMGRWHADGRQGAVLVAGCVCACACACMCMHYAGVKKCLVVREDVTTFLGTSQTRGTGLEYTLQMRNAAEILVVRKQADATWEMHVSVRRKCGAAEYGNAECKPRTHSFPCSWEELVTPESCSVEAPGTGSQPISALSGVMLTVLCCAKGYGQLVAHRLYLTFNRGHLTFNLSFYLR